MKMVPRFELCISLLIVCNCFVSCSFSSEKLLSDLQLADFSLVDACEDLSRGLRSGILRGDFKEKLDADIEYGNLLKSVSESLKGSDDVPEEISRNVTYLVKPGDGLLSKDDWDALASYHISNEELETFVKVPCPNGTDECLFTKGEYQGILQTSRDVDLLNTTWFSWQHVFGANLENFTRVLELTKKAAQANEFHDVLSYWENLLDFPGAYSKAKEFWEEIKPLYTKLHIFVRERLNNYYKLNETSEIPVFLLGSNFGHDWSYIADILLPHPQLHYDVETFLKYKNLVEIYRLADNLTQAVSLGALGEDFWSNSNFNLSFCEPQIFSFCDQKYSEVYDCDKPSWTAYLDAHVTAFKIGLRNQDYLSLMRLNLRDSGIDEAIASLGSILAIESIHYHGVNTVNDATDESVKMTKLLLTALRLLPQLPYYLAADEWRLQELDVASENIAKNWWNVRKDFQGIKSVTGAEHDFLRDSLITSNKPYISKFVGIILAFQFVEYYRSQMTDPDANIAMEFGKDESLKSMIRERGTIDWSYQITISYGLDLSTSALLKYFQPLEQYLDEAPKEQAPIVTTTTTTTTTTATPPPTTTNAVEVVKKKEKILDGKSGDTVQSDQPKANGTFSGNEATSGESHLSMYVGVGLLILVACVVVAVFGYKYVVRRRRRSTNNRRFQA